MVVFTLQTLLKHKYEDNVKGLEFFFSVGYIFSFGFSVGFDGNNN